jgi:hypothetical protein
MRILVVVILFGLFSFTVPAWAQINTDIVGDAMSITLEPQYPGPNERVTASLDDYSIDSSGATIIWIIDGVEVAQFKNTRSINLITPAVGKNATIIARLLFSNRPTLEAKISITPLYTDIIIEPLTYTPLFYSGRSLPVHGSVVNITALLFNSVDAVTTADYTYNWQLNGKTLYGGPQSGNNRAQIVVPYGQNSLIGVTITNKSGAVVSRKLVNIPQAEVDLTFYEVSTLYGLSQRAIGETLTLVGNSSTIRAVPYYIDARAVSNSLFTEWSVGGRVANTESEDPFEINLLRQREGSTQVSFKIRNLSELLQGDQKSFRAQF